MTTKLKVYNEALLICGERRLSTITDAIEARYLLDDVYNNGGVNLCLESGQWKFAMRTIEIDASTTVEPTYGLANAFEKPTDWVLTSAICSDEYFQVPLLDALDEAGYWYSDTDPIYVRYVSNDTEYGMDLASWPARFAEFVAAHFASKIIMKLTSDKEKRQQVMDYRKKTLSDARTHDAFGDPVKFPPSGSWSSARRGHSFRDRGKRNTLIG